MLERKQKVRERREMTEKQRIKRAKLDKKRRKKKKKYRSSDEESSDEDKSEKKKRRDSSSSEEKRKKPKPLVPQLENIAPRTMSTRRTR